MQQVSPKLTSYLISGMFTVITALLSIVNVILNQLKHVQTAAKG